MIVIVLAFLLVTLCTSLCILLPGTPLAGAVASILPLSEPHAAAAEAALRTHSWAAARRETAAELSTSPIRQDAWLRLAEIDIFEHGRLTQVGQSALVHAYDALPYDLYPASPRMSFVMAHFAALAPQVRHSVEDELSLWAGSPPLRRHLAAVEANARDAAALTAIKSALAWPDEFSTPEPPAIAAKQVEGSH